MAAQNGTDLRNHFAHLHRARQLMLEHEDMLMKFKLLHEDQFVLKALHTMNMASRLMDELAANALQCAPQFVVWSLALYDQDS